MKILFYKPKKPILFNDSNDTASWSRENVNLINFLQQLGYEVKILSATDNKQFKIDETEAKKQHWDYLIVSNGLFENDEEEKLHSLVSYDKSILLSTDLTLTTLSKAEYDYIFSQTPENLSGKTIEFYIPDEKNPSKKIKKTLTFPKGKWMYMGLEKLFLLSTDIKQPTENELFRDFKNRSTKAYFAGDERWRLDDMIEYIWNEKVEWNGKSKFLNIKKKIPVTEVQRKLQRHLYTIIIADPHYNQTGFVTQRFYEAVVNGTIPFVDKKYDKYELTIPKNHYLRVSNRMEFFEKMNEVTNNFDLYKELRLFLYDKYTTAKEEIKNALYKFFTN